jgi:hypothetical protein
MNQRQIRRAFWEAHPDLPRERIPDFSGNGTMYKTDTRCAFAEFIGGKSIHGLPNGSQGHPMRNQSLDIVMLTAVLGGFTLLLYLWADIAHTLYTPILSALP